MKGLPLFLALTSLAWSRAGAEVALVQGGRAETSIVIPGEAGSTVQFAAEELARYIEAMSGAQVPIVTEGRPVAGVPIHVGATKVALAASPPALEDNAESIFLHANGERVIVLGGSDRGTLFAAYRFLEQGLGCRWLAPDVEHVPKQSTIRVPDMDLTTAPVFDMRTFVGRREGSREWGAKVGMNGFYTKPEAAIAGNSYYLPDQVPGCHAYHCIVPAEQYFEAHPEWYPLIGGERQPGVLHGRQLCVTAPGLADEFAKNVITMFDEDPNLQTVSISPNDGRGWCECDGCMALDEKLCGARTTQQGLGGERPFRGDRVFWFANEVAGRVAQVHPGKKLLVLAYINYAEPPDTIKPAENVLPWLCHYAPADYSRPINDPTSEPNAQFNGLLQRWAKSAPHLLLYAYVSKSMWWRLPRPVTRTFAGDVKYLHSLGIRRYYCQSSLSDWPLDGPLYYVIAKLLWDPSADPETIAADWTRHMFGPASESMTEFYRLAQESIRESGQSFSDNPPRDVPGLFDFADLEAALVKLDEAAAAADTEESKERVKRVADTFRYGYHMARCIEAAGRFSEEPTRAMMREVIEQGETALAISRPREAVRFLDSMRMTDEMGVIAKGFGEAMELGGRRCWNSDETGLGDGAAGWATFVIETPDTSKPVRVEIDTWGTSTLGQVVVNTGGLGKGYSAGGIWTPVRPEEPLSGEEKWDTLVFIVPPEAMAPGKKVQTIGFGGSDSQVWMANIRVKPLE
jgi:hypothetical protein